jgi:hypothetical protein
MRQVGIAFHSLRAVDTAVIREVLAARGDATGPLHVHIAEQPAEQSDGDCATATPAPSTAIATGNAANFIINDMGTSMANAGRARQPPGSTLRPSPDPGPIGRESPPCPCAGIDRITPRPDASQRHRRQP